jgi:hypothetical protein
MVMVNAWSEAIAPAGGFTGPDASTDAVSSVIEKTMCRGVGPWLGSSRRPASATPKTSKKRSK